MQFHKLAALGALGACGGIALLYAGIVWLTFPHRATAGIDLTNAAVAWVALGVVVLILIAAHLAIGHQLWNATPAPVPTSRQSRVRRKKGSR